MSAAEKAPGVKACKSCVETRDQVRGEIDELGAWGLALGELALVDSRPQHHAQAVEAIMYAIETRRELITGGALDLFCPKHFADFFGDSILVHVGGES